MKEFPDGASYEKKTNDMRLLTIIEKKMGQKRALNKEELEFLYEINSPIEGFGYRKDPRIADLIDQRNRDLDLTVIFNCKSNQIAHYPWQVNDKTMVYIGEISDYLFYRLPKNITHVYTDFPENRIEFQTIQIGGTDERELKQLLIRHGDQFFDFGNVINNSNFSRSLRVGDDEESDWKKLKLNAPKEVRIVRLRVRDLGFEYGAGTRKIKRRADRTGLEPCPPEIGLQFCLQNTSHSVHRTVYFNMKSISRFDKYYNSRFFAVDPIGDASSGLRIRSCDDLLETEPGYDETEPEYAPVLDPYDELVFLFPEK
jgi:hypothetical protein